MTDIPLKSLPAFIFAHKYSAEDYNIYIKNVKNHVEITVITEGALCIETESGISAAEKGDIVFRYNKDVRAFATAPHTHHTVCFYVEGAEEFLSRVPSVIHSHTNAPVCLNIIDKIIQTRVIDPENALKLSGLFLELLGEIELMMRLTGKKGNPAEDGYVKRAKKYIYEHVSEQIVQKDIADMLGITPEYLCTIFKRHEGRSIVRFVNETKLSFIRDLMENNKLTLDRAALQYGFPDPNYVSKLYKKYYGQPITESLKNLKRPGH